jgi:hypothetical protein
MRAYDNDARSIIAAPPSASWPAPRIALLPLDSLEFVGRVGLADPRSAWRPTTVLARPDYGQREAEKSSIGPQPS